VDAAGAIARKWGEGSRGRQNKGKDAGKKADPEREASGILL
jgi:hypothetical protein